MACLYLFPSLVNTEMNSQPRGGRRSEGLESSSSLSLRLRRTAPTSRPPLSLSLPLQASSCRPRPADTIDIHIDTRTTLPLPIRFAISFFSGGPASAGLRSFSLAPPPPFLTASYQIAGEKNSSLPTGTNSTPSTRLQWWIGSQPICEGLHRVAYVRTCIHPSIYR